MSKLQKAILLRLTDEDKLLLQEKANKKRMTLTGYIRNELLNN
jgi:uncharacterized protein (DUF1778 family)|tara:strand:+ start:1824 stop:1952 length:129 start_codon:yes stop_codon:yes gene_type:complete